MRIHNPFKYLNSKNINCRIQLIYYNNLDFDLLIRIQNPFEFLNSKNI